VIQIKLFTLPAMSSDSEDSLNRFLRSHRVLEVDRHLVQMKEGAFWCFCVSYLESPNDAGRSKSRSQRVDYKNVLDESSFKRFAALRTIRKKIAQEEGIPAFAIFTDQQMAELAKLEEFTITGMQGINGIGEKKASRFGPAILKLLNTDKTEE